MNFDSGKLLHIGINYVIAPVSNIEVKKTYQFQGHLIDAKLGITENRSEGSTILAIRTKPTPLEIKVSTVGPQVAQLLIVAPHPNRAFEVFVDEAKCVVDAFIKTWQTQSFQILKSDATIRYLYDSNKAHAFSEIWEDKLGMEADVLGVFERPVLSGGLRFVMPARDGEDDPKEIDLRIESYVHDSKQIFVETRFIWPHPTEANNVSEFQVTEHLKGIEDFIESKVHKFMEAK